jgi:leucyl aminopeptidase
MKINVKTEIANNKTDLLFLGLFDGEKLPKNLSTKNEKIINHIKALILDKQIKSEIGSVHVFSTLDANEAKMIGIIGLGKKEELSAESARLIGGHIVASARSNKAAKVAIDITDLDVLALSEGLYLGDYQFAEYKTKNADEFVVQSITIVSQQSVDKTKLKEVENLTDGVKFVRNLVNRPASQVYPKVLADEAEKIAKESSGLISVKIMSKADLTKMGANAILAVASGSEHEPFLIHLTYNPSKILRFTQNDKVDKQGNIKNQDSKFPIPNSPSSVAIVGKGVTFDSGGLSLKPGEALEDMKSDMAGAAAVLGVFKCITNLKPNITVHGIIPCVENMLSDRSMRVGDVIKTLSGKTVEVLNTDAEGRLILADALTYAEQQKPNAIVDLATLTGACIVALGEQYSGVMGDKAVVEALLTASETSGEKIWELPLPTEYKEKMKSDVADLSNIHKGRYGGAIMGGLFLKEFIQNTPWAHIDIAGPSYNRTPLNSYSTAGASGVGVRLITNWLSVLHS